MAEPLVKAYVDSLLRHAVEIASCCQQSRTADAYESAAPPAISPPAVARPSPQRTSQPGGCGVGLCGSFAAGRGAVWRRIERPGMRHYYYNEELNESRWERPVVEKPKVVHTFNLPAIPVAAKWPATAAALPAIASTSDDAARGTAGGPRQVPGLQLPLLSFQGRSNNKSRPPRKRAADPAMGSIDGMDLVQAIWEAAQYPYSARPAESSREPLTAAAPASARQPADNVGPREQRVRGRARQDDLPENMSAVSHIGRRLPYGLPEKLAVSRDDEHFHARTHEWRLQKLQALKDDPAHQAIVNRNIESIAKWERKERQTELRRRAAQRDTLLKRAAERHAELLREEERRRLEQVHVPQDAAFHLKHASTLNLQDDDEAQPRRTRSESMFTHGRRLSTIAGIADVAGRDLSRPLSPSSAASDRHRARLLAAEIARLSRG